MVKNQTYGLTKVFDDIYIHSECINVVVGEITEKSNCMNSQFSETRALVGKDMKF